MKKPLRRTVAAPTITECDPKLEVLRPLLVSVPKYLQGDTYVEALSGSNKAICMSCGARDNMVMIRKHKKGCEWMAWWNARQALQDMLNPPNAQGS